MAGSTNSSAATVTTAMAGGLAVPSDCDVSPIHQFSSVQAHGALIAFSWPDQRVQIVSQNTKSFLNRAQSDVLGAKLDYIFDRKFVGLVGEVIGSRPWSKRGLHLEMRAHIDDQQFDVFLFESEGLFVLELEKMNANFEPKEVETIDRESILQEFSMAAKQTKSVAELGKLVCRSIRRVTGLDRVMVYRFAPPDWHGEVIAEDRVTSAHAYLGHRFPATDIPLPARNLYLRNQVRLIADAQAETVSLTPGINPKTRQPLDMSDSRLRSAAPIHVEYLKNMGVRASFSVAITEGERLWGLVTCHHFSELIISQSKRTICQIIADAYSALVTVVEQNASLNSQVEFEFKLKQLLGNLLRSEHPRDEFFRQHRTVSEAFDVSGIALVDDTLKDFAGLTPLKKDLEELAAAVRAEMAKTSSTVLAVESVVSLDPKFETMRDYVSGVLAIQMPSSPNAVLMMLRPEVLREISWGGDPRKQLEKRNFSGVIHPRESFATWTQQINLQSKPWRSFEIEGLTFIRDVFRGHA